MKLSDNPPLLYPEVATLTALPGRWWVAHTKARAEKALAWDLLRRGVGYFLPLTERITFSGGRKRRVLHPLFPSYLFFCGNEHDRHTALATDRICQVIDVPQQRELVNELAAVERALNSNAMLDIYPHAAIGQRCRISDGPFAGLEGVVVQRAQVARVVLQVGMLGQGVAMEIDSALLEPAGLSTSMVV